MLFEDVPVDVWYLFVNLLHNHTVQRLALSCTGASQLMTRLLKRCTFHSKFMPVTCVGNERFSGLERIDTATKWPHSYRNLLPLQMSTLTNLRRLSCSIHMLVLDSHITTCLPRLEHLTMWLMPCTWYPTEGGLLAEWRPTKRLPAMPMLTCLELTVKHQLGQNIIVLANDSYGSAPDNCFDLRETLRRLTTLDGLFICRPEEVYPLSLLERVQKLKVFVSSLGLVSEELADINSSIVASISQMTTLTDLHLPADACGQLLNEHPTFSTVIRSLSGANDRGARFIVNRATTAWKFKVRDNKHVAFNIGNTSCANASILTKLDLRGIRANTDDSSNQLFARVVFPCLANLKIDMRHASFFPRPTEQLPTLRKLWMMVSLAGVNLLLSLPTLDALTLDFCKNVSAKDRRQITDIVSRSKTFTSWPVVRYIKIPATDNFDSSLCELFMEKCSVFQRAQELSLRSGVMIAHHADIIKILKCMPNVRRVFISIYIQLAPLNMNDVCDLLAQQHHLSLLAVNTKVWTAEREERIVRYAPERSIVWKQGLDFGRQRDIRDLFTAIREGGGVPKSAWTIKAPKYLLGSKRWQVRPFPVQK